MEITYGYGGWVSVAGIGLPGLLWVRFYMSGGIGELFLEAGGEDKSLTARDLRGIPLANIAAVALSRPDLLGGLANAETPDLRAQLDAIVPRRAKHRGRPDINATLHPPTAGLTDAFLEQVAKAYTAAVARGERPNKSLAEQSQTPLRTVERWVYLARKQKLLPPTRPGGVA